MVRRLSAVRMRAGGLRAGVLRAGGLRAGGVLAGGVRRAVGLSIALTLSSVAAHAHSPGAAATSGGDSELGALLPLAICALLFFAGSLRLGWTAGRGLRIAAFVSGWLALALALLSPIDTMGADLFSAHMVQHEVLMLVAAPLLVLGHPLPVFLWAFPASARRRIASACRLSTVQTVWATLTQPLSGWLLHAAALWGWHAPALFEAALEHPWVHTLQHLTFLLTALLFWNGLLRSRSTGNDGASVLYLFTTTVHSGVLGALITCATHPWFPHYRETAPAFGFSALEDQQLGGLIMWIPGSLVYVGIGLFLLARWVSTSSQQLRPTSTYPCRHGGG
ncbi:MAG: cytochrome c oxidase assembly protein [Proteobacteria bacterium]|nr:cytochrome c oxidase assembly protein [Pseudomonadota bacterium]